MLSCLRENATVCNACLSKQHAASRRGRPGQLRSLAISVKLQPRCRRVRTFVSEQFIRKRNSSVQCYAADPARGDIASREQKWCDCLVVVEGASDQRAVARSVASQVFVLHGASKSGSLATAQALKARASKCKQAIALLDPDVAGRQSRTVVDACLAGRCLHAFIPQLHATAARDVRHKLAGNVGVEHATASQIRFALQNARPSCPGRSEFCRADLVEWGLVAEMGSDTAYPPQGGAAAKRAAFSAALGLGNCDGKQLLRQLNVYGFSQRDVARALNAVYSTCDKFALAL